MFQYIGNKKGMTVHLWLPEVEDTACTQWSSGGIRDKHHYIAYQSASRKKVCHMCNQFTHKLDERIAKLKARRSRSGVAPAEPLKILMREDLERMGFFREI
jgi:hypothetical protein